MNKLLSLEEVKNFVKESEMALLYIATNNCSVCDAVFTKVEVLMKKFPQVPSSYVKVDEVSEIAGEFMVFSAPTILLFVDGREVLRQSRFIELAKVEYDLTRWTEA